MQISSTNWVGTNVWATDEDLEDQIVLPGHTHNGTNSPKVAWGSIDAKPSTFTSTIGDGNRALKVYIPSVFTNGRAYALQITGTYEAA